MKRLVFLAVVIAATFSCGKEEFSQTCQAPLGDIRALYIELGHNMWCDWPTPAMGDNLEAAVKMLPADRIPDLKLKCEDEVWRKVTDHAAEAGINMLVVDLGEGLQFPSHPELAIEGSWSVEKMRAEIKRLNGLGIEVIPKLNFSNSHNGWMKDYRHMVSSAPYLKMCEDVIADALEIFGHPRFFHIGFDEEDVYHTNKMAFQCRRVDEVWWHDFLYIVGIVEKYGARPWAWSDYGWEHPEFYTRCPKSVVLQNWYYDERNAGFDPETVNDHDRSRLMGYVELDKAGYDQVPCGTNWAGYVRKREGVGGEDVPGRLVKYCRGAITNKEHLYGFMIAPWAICDSAGLAFQLRGIDLFREALAQ